MKKNAFLTFLFACIPGAGQMYYGYMKRGVSVISYFCLAIVLGSILSPLIVAACVVYMFSFFDTYDLIRYLAAGEPKPDGFLLPPGSLNALQSRSPRANKVVGWGLVLLGVYVLYNNFLKSTLENLLEMLNLMYSPLWDILHSLPTIAVAVALIWFGARLLRGTPRRDTHDDLPPYRGGNDGTER